MPRNITVTLADGQQHVYANAPDDLTPDAVTARAQKDFGQSVTALDGGRGSAPARKTPAPDAATTPADRQRQYGKFSAASNTQALNALRVADTNFRASLKAKGLTGPALDTAMTTFRADPRYQALSARARNQDAPALTTAGRDRLAGKTAAPAAPTKREQIRAAAQRAVDEAGTGAGGFGNAFAAATRRYMFGIPERIAASGLYATQKGNNSYSDVLQLVRDKTDIEMGQSTPGNIAGSVVGSVASGRAVTGALAPVAARMGVAASPVISRTGNFLQNLMNLRKGQTLANAGKVITTGAAGGATQAVGEGSDPVKGAAYGAGGATVLGTGFKAAQVLTRPFRDVVRLSSAGRILSRLTTATTDQLSARAAAYRQATGAEPTLFELLPLADRNKILKQAVVGRDGVVEATSDAIRARAANLGPEMSARARAILQPRREAITAGMRRDLTQARGGTPDAGDAALAGNAAHSPTDMLELRDAEARAIMGPHENTPVVDNLDELYPSVPSPDGTARISTDPEVSAVIRSAASTLTRRAENAGISAGEISNMISTLQGDLGRGGIEGRTAERAIAHLHDMLDEAAPEAGAAAREMNAAYAARSRMAEGMQEGAATRMRDDVQVGTSRREARRVRNAYDSAEGTSGRALGQGNRVLGNLEGSPEEALRATVGMSRNSTGRQLAQNVGADEANQIMAAARAQDTSAQALASASQTAQSGGGEAANAETLVSALAGLHPSSFITTKAGAIRKLLDMTYIPESRARTMVDMIFSQNPAMVRRAISAVGNEKNGATFLKYLSGVTGMTAGGVGAAAEPENTGPSVEDDLQADENIPSAAADIGDEEPDASAAGPVDESNSPYSAQLQSIYDNESPEMLDLISRVSGQESGDSQFDESGAPITSSAGAIGVMQVMPDTAPEAARLAGVPFDDNAYRNDAAYNKLIGIAYLSELLRRYDGDVAKATAAYNAGPGRIEAALKSHGENWLAAVPAETQDYVRKVA